MTNTRNSADFQEIENLVTQLSATEYDTDKLLASFKDMLHALNFFYGYLVNKHPDISTSRLMYYPCEIPQEHQLIFVQLGRGYTKEMHDPHWCYVLKDYGSKLFVVPTTSIKEDSSPAHAPYEYDIEEESGVKCRLHFDEARPIDKMRIFTNRPYREVKTERSEIQSVANPFFSI